MKIAYVVTDLDLGGTQYWVDLTATELASRGHHVLVLAEHGPFHRCLHLQAGGVAVHCCDAPAPLEDYARLLRSEQVEIVHLNVWERPAELIRLGPLTGIPLALAYHHVPKVSWRTWLGYLARPMAGARFAKRWLSLSRCVAAHVGCCQASAAGIRRELGPLLGRRIFGLRNAIPIPSTTVSAQVIHGAPRFLQAGWLSERKRPDVTLRAFANLRRAFPDATLTFVGDGPLRGQLEEQIGSEGIAGVTLAGASADVEPYYLASNVFVLPSVNEGLPYTLIEAAARGIPLVATCIDGIPEVVVQDHNGILVRPDDRPGLETAMERLASSPHLRAQMGENGRRLVQERFEIGAQIDRLLGIYTAMRSRRSWVAGLP